MFRRAFFSGMILIIVMIIIYFFYSNYNISEIELFELKSLDIRYSLKNGIINIFNKKNLEKDVVIIGIDEKSLNHFGAWPWKRSIHGKLVTSLKEYGVKVVGFDVSFTEDGENSEFRSFINEVKDITLKHYKNKQIQKPAAYELAKKLSSKKFEEDKKFAESMKEANNVFIGTYNIEKKPKYKLNYKDSDENFFQNKLKNSYNYLTGIVEIRKEEYLSKQNLFNPYTVHYINPPIEEIAFNCKGYAPYEVGKPDPDGVFRDIPLITHQEEGNLFFPPLHFLMYLHYINKSIKNNVRLNLIDKKVEIYKSTNFDEKPEKTIPINKDGYNRLMYYGPGGTFKYYSYIDVIDKIIDKNYLEGKIALVGYTNTAKGLYDLRATPFDPNMAGVEIHATAIQNLIDNAHLVRLELIPNSIILLLFGLGLCIFMSIKRLSINIKNAFSILLILFYLFIAQYLIFKNIWLELFFPLISLVLLYVELTVINYIVNDAEKNKIKSIFRHYSSKELIDELLKKPDKLKLGGEKRNLSVMFSDIAGFTTISEQMSPEELVEFLNEYLSAMTDIILANRGTIDKYEGDAILAIFGAPLHYEDHAKMCCKAALECMSKLKELNENWKSIGKQEIGVRIGINSGEMVVGNMGSDNRFDYTVIGDNVNLASRLEGANKVYGTDIMISENTYKEIQSEFETMELDIIRVKGKLKGIKVYELICKKGDLLLEKFEERDRFINALNKYNKRDFKNAMQEFEILKRDFGNKKVFNEFVERSRVLCLEPPSENWDGVYEMKTK